MDEKHVPIVGKTSEDRCFGANDLRKVAFEPVGVKWNFSPHDDVVPLAVNVEGDTFVNSDFDGRVDEDVVVRSEQRKRVSRRCVQATGNLPVRRRFETNEDGIASTIRERT